MREHKYKAKRLDNGEWIEGYLWRDTTGSYYIRKEIGLAYATMVDFEVDPDTICEFTGEYDKEGNMIWEHDIVINEKETGIIIYETNYHAFVCLHLKNTDLFSFISNLGACAKQISNDAGCKIIGNIFDNPELLEVK